MTDLPIGTRVRIKDADPYEYPVDTGVIIEPDGWTSSFEYHLQLDRQEGNTYYAAKEFVVELIENETSTIRGGVLLEAKSLIEGDRNVTYGTPTENFTNIAAVWNVLFAHKFSENNAFTPGDVAEAMIALKLCRNIAEKKRDNAVDIAGYAACGYEASL